MSTDQKTCHLSNLPLLIQTYLRNIYSGLLFRLMADAIGIENSSANSAIYLQVARILPEWHRGCSLDLMKRDERREDHGPADFGCVK
jgi:hypothetical protein